MAVFILVVWWNYVYSFLRHSQAFKAPLVLMDLEAVVLMHLEAVVLMDLEAVVLSWMPFVPLAQKSHTIPLRLEATSSVVNMYKPMTP